MDVFGVGVNELCDRGQEWECFLRGRHSRASSREAESGGVHAAGKEEAL